jgi:NAD(P)-dependent dehydrogenase (short-subunit alcohol dehydrogenase family)
MDVGLQGRNAIVCAASQGLGKASAMALAREGINLVIAAAAAMYWRTPQTRSPLRQETGLKP